MKAILLVLTFVSTLAAADPRIDNMVRSCESAMSQGLCRVALDRKNYPNEYVLFAGLGRVRTDAYLWIRGPGEAKNPDGTYVMCTRIREACTRAWDGPDERCKAARFNWRQG